MLGVHPDGNGHFLGERVPIVMYVCMSALRIVSLLPWANVPAQRTRHTNALAAAGVDTTVMRPFAKITLDVCLLFRNRSAAST